MRLILSVLVLLLTAQILCAHAASPTVTFDERLKGAVTHLTAADGHDFIAPGARDSLFQLKLTREDVWTNSVYADAAKAKSCTIEKTAGETRLVYTSVGPAVEKVVCTASLGQRTSPSVDSLHWRIVVTPAAGWRLEETHYPRLKLAASIGDDPAKTTLVTGDAKGSLLRNPAATPVGKVVYSGLQPRQIAVQLLSLYDDDHLFYFGSEDGHGGTKRFTVRRHKDGLLFNICRYGWDAGVASNGYDIVTAMLVGDGTRPLDWMDAADLYRPWASRQRWCKARLVDREDLPAWMKDAPVLVRFYRGNLEKPETIRAWLRNTWRKEYLGVPFIATFWGFEQRGMWVSDYFPAYPSDEEFMRLTADVAMLGGHSFVWPSGYHWTIQYDKQTDGSFAYDDSTNFYQNVASHAVFNRDGSLYDRPASWMRGGHLACLCPGDKWTRDWFNRDVALACAKRGCELVQIDQVVGGGYPGCWAKDHPHPPGDGVWKVDVFREQLRTMARTMRQTGGDAVVCFEEPCEYYNDLIGIQDFRDCNHTREWAGVFNYLYHEYVPCFQACLYSLTQRHWYAHMAAEGQLPVFAAPLSTEKDVAWCERFMRSWVSLYRGEGRAFLAHGRRIRPPRVTCATVRPTEKCREGNGEMVTVERPAVHHAAFESADGRRALALANATSGPQEVVYEERGAAPVRLTVAPASVQLVPLHGADAHE